MLLVCDKFSRIKCLTEFRQSSRNGVNSVLFSFRLKLIGRKLGRATIEEEGWVPLATPLRGGGVILYPHPLLYQPLLYYLVRTL